MKQILLSLSFILPVAVLTAQVCTPDDTYADSSAGVYPLPYEPDLNPTGGITECATIGEFFQFDFTVVVGDTLTVGGFSFPLDSVIVSDVEGLPQGISYSCNPTNCHFKKNTIGCAAIYGTPTGSNPVGEYDLTIKGAAYINGSSLPLPLEFPNDQLAPGKYTIHLLGSPNDPCNATATNHLEKQVSIRTMPNPTTGPVTLDIASMTSGSFSLRVVDFQGQTLEVRPVELYQGRNTLSFDGTHLSNGLYLLILQNERGYVSQRVMVQR